MMILGKFSRMIGTFVAFCLLRASWYSNVILIDKKTIPKGLLPLDNSFSLSDVGSKNTSSQEASKRKVSYTILMNIGADYDPKTLHISANCFKLEKKNNINLFLEFRDVFVYSYDEFFGFDLRIIHHAITIKYNTIPIWQRQQLVTLAFEATIRREVEKMLNANIITGSISSPTIDIHKSIWLSWPCS